MSLFTGIPTELLYSFAGASTNLATFTTEDNLQKTYPECPIPSEYLRKLGSQSSSLKVRMSGQVGSTGSPTFTFTLRLLTSTTWSAGGVLLASTAALTAGATVTLAPFTIDVDISLRALSIGAASTLVTTGVVLSQTGFTTVGTFPAANVSPAVATVDPSQQYYLFLSAACGTSNAANLINLQTMKVYGEN